MKEAFINIFTYLGHHLLGPSPDFDQVIWLVMAFCLAWMLIVHVLILGCMSLVNVWLERRAQKNLLRAGTQLGFQVRQEPKVFARTSVSEGTYRGRTVRFFTGRWRGHPFMAVAAACRESTDLWIRISPNLGWFLNFTVNAATCRPKDLRSREIWLRAFPIGDPAFDKAYVVKSNQHAVAVTKLTRKIQDELLAVRRPFRKAPTVTLTEGEIYYALHPGFFLAATASRLAEKLDFVCNLAEAVEKR